jgi:hypothetical protein
VIGGAVPLGSSYSGHYFAVSNRGNDWFKLDDERTEQITEEKALDLLSKSGTVLLMEKVEGPSHKAVLTRLEKGISNKSSNHFQKTNAEETIGAENNTLNFFRVYSGGKAWWKFYIRKEDQSYDPYKNVIYTKQKKVPAEGQTQ